jgi:hypothetical protein
MRAEFILSSFLRENAEAEILPRSPQPKKKTWWGIESSTNHKHSSNVILSVTGGRVGEALQYLFRNLNNGQKSAKKMNKVE